MEINPIPIHSKEYTMSIIELAEKAAKENIYEKALISKLVGDRPPDFIFIPGKYFITLHPVIHQINRINFIGDNFTSKHEICNVVDRANLKMQKDNFIPFPRVFKILCDEDIDDFKIEYNWTMVTSLIMYMADENGNSIFSPRASYTVDCEGLELALRFIDARIDEIEGRITHDSMLLTGSLTDYQWSSIRKTYLGIVKIKQAIYARSSMAELYMQRILDAKQKLLQYFPWVTLDGVLNIVCK